MSMLNFFLMLVYFPILCYTIISILYHIILYYATQYHAVLHYIVPFCSVLRCAVLYYTALTSDILHWVILFRAVLCCAVTYLIVIYYIPHKFQFLYCTVLYCITSWRYATEWLLTMYCRGFSFDLVTRVWDVFFSEGYKIVYRVALALVKVW